MSTSRWRERWHARRYDLGAFAMFSLFFAVFFRPALFSGKFFLTADSYLYSYPLRTIAWDQLRHGKLPLWTTQIMSGYPLLSMAQIGIGYPLTWFYAFLSGHVAETIYVLAPYVLFPCFIYCYLREIGRSRLASIMAGLTFGYGGFLVSQVAYNGLLANAVMWLPLMLIAIERARTRSFIRCLLAATAAYSMSVLTGVGQGFLMAGTIAILYAGFMVVVNKRGAQENLRSRWRPLMVTLLAILMSTGVAAFQILETLRAQRRSIRSQLSYDNFAFGSYRPGDALKAIWTPLYYHLEASGYVIPLALILAIIAIVVAVRSPDRDRRVFFWAGLAMIAFVLTLGENTPVFALLYRVPPFNLFRGAARHAFELTLAVGMLAAYGWDAIETFVSRRHSQRSIATNKLAPVFALLPVGLVALVGIWWLIDFARIPIGEREVYYYPPGMGALRYAIWKSLFSALTLFAAWCAWKLGQSRRRSGILLVLVMLACFFEPSIMVARWWWPTLKTADRFSAASPTTKFVQGFPPRENRIYTYAYPFIEEYSRPQHLEPGNLTMLHGLQNVGGYEPLILERYSRALGNTYLDAVGTRPGYAPDKTRFESGSHVLDLLNTRFVVSYEYLATEHAPVTEKDGIKFSFPDLDKTLGPGETVTLKGVAAEADTLALITSTAFSTGAPDGTPVARVRLFSPDGKMVERGMRLGMDTAEWAHDRPDVLPIVRHSRAPVFSDAPGDANNTFLKHNYIARLALGERVQVDHIEIANVSTEITLILNKATLVDSARNFSMPLPHYNLNKWQSVYDDGVAVILENKNVLPRAWLVAEAEAVDGEEALLRIRGAGAAFDPSRTALLEIPAASLPALPGGRISPSASARIVEYEDNRLVIGTAAETPSVLVISEINYPGWIASVDGQSAPIHTTDFLLRGIALSAGGHRVEMRYTAPAARNGAIISGLTILLIGALALYERRQTKRAGEVPLDGDANQI